MNEHVVPTMSLCCPVCCPHGVSRVLQPVKDAATGILFPQGGCHRTGLNAASDSQPTVSCVCGGGFSRSTGQGFLSLTDNDKILVTPMSLAVICLGPGLIRFMAVHVATGSNFPPSS